MTRAAINTLCELLVPQRSRFQLRRGATAKQLADFSARLARLGQKPPADLLTFYGHFNGCSESIDGYYRLLTLSEILSHKRTLDRLEADGHFADWRPGTWWNPAWLPFAWFEGDYLAIDLGGTLAKPRGQILEFRASSPARNLLHRSLAAWLEVLVRTIELAPASADGYSEFFSTPAARRLRKQLHPQYPIVRAAAPASSQPTTGRGVKTHVYQRGPYRWRIEVDGTSVVTAHGRGYSMLERRKRFPTRAAAALYRESAVAKKVAAGYVQGGVAHYQ